MTQTELLGIKIHNDWSEKLFVGLKSILDKDG